jgi:hypothetical protein
MGIIIGAERKAEQKAQALAFRPKRGSIFTVYISTPPLNQQKKRALL